MASRRIEGNFNQGWGIGLLVVALAVGAFVVAGMIHQRTYRSPLDPLASSSVSTTAERH
jgi:hypothetical protein